MRLSTPEAAALDLLRDVAAAGSLSTVATGLHDLAEPCDAGRLVEAAQTGELPHAQRLRSRKKCPVSHAARSSTLKPRACRRATKRFASFALSRRSKWSAPRSR